MSPVNATNLIMFNLHAIADVSCIFYLAGWDEARAVHVLASGEILPKAAVTTFISHIGQVCREKNNSA